MLAMYSKLYTVVRTEEILPLRPYCPACLQGLDHLFAVDADGFPGDDAGLATPRRQASALGIVVHPLAERLR